MLKLLLLLIYIFSKSIEYDVDDTIIELVQKNYYFNSSSFKIFKYIPSCEKNIKTKNVYVQTDKRLYLYDDFSNIEKHKYNRSLGDSSNFVKNLTCGKEYYFVSYPGQKILLDLYKILIINEDETINLSPLTNSISFIQRIKNKEERFNYYYNESKKVLISFYQYSKIKIIMNDSSIICKEETFSDFFKVYEFKENTHYTIFFNVSSDFYLISNSQINFQFYDNEQFFKHDFKKEPAIIYSNNLINYYFDIDISDYKLGENIIFYISGDEHSIGYQFNINFNENNYIKFKTYYNFISIEKTKNVSSLIIYFQYYKFLPFTNDFYSMINIIKPEEIKTEYDSIIKGPKLFYIDYKSLNGMNSIGIESNISFFTYAQEQIYKDYRDIYKIYSKLYITKQNNTDFDKNKKAIIYFNTTDYTLFKVKKLNYSIFFSYFEKDESDIPRSEYFQLCQGDNSPKELYFYISKKEYIDASLYHVTEIFSSVFGKYNSYFINERNIKNISDLNFDNIDEYNLNYFRLSSGYLKINCSNPVMIRHSNILLYSNNILSNIFNSGGRYYLNLENYRENTKFTFNNNLMNKNIELKFTIFGLLSNESIEVSFNDVKSYKLNNTSLKVNYTYDNKNNNGFSFKGFNKIESYFIFAEVIVGFLPEEINNYQIIDLENTFGTNSIYRKATFIKIPKNFDKNFYDFSIFLSKYLNSVYDIQISYDDLQFITPFQQHVTYYSSPYSSTNFTKMSPIIPLFKVNPYEQISENKYFYILLYNYKNNLLEFSIKKPIIFNDTIDFEIINHLPKLNDKKNYYTIKVPKADYNSLFVETIYSSNDLKIALLKDNSEYQFTPSTLYYDNKYYMSSIRSDCYLYQFIIYNIDQDLYLNYYEANNDNVYIYFNNNISSINVYDINWKKYNSPKIEVIEENNTIKINMLSVSYHLNQNLYNYYIIINSLSSFNFNTFYSIIANKTEINNLNNEFMTIIEDNGTNQTFECEIEIDIQLKRNNSFVLVPVGKENNLPELNYIVEESFSYSIEEKEEKEKEGSKKTSTALIVVFIIIGVILVIIFALIIYFKFYKKKFAKKSSDDIFYEPLTKDSNFELSSI